MYPIDILYYIYPIDTLHYVYSVCATVCIFYILYIKIYFLCVCVCVYVYVCIFIYFGCPHPHRSELGDGTHGGGLLKVVLNSNNFVANL